MIAVKVVSNFLPLIGIAAIPIKGRLLLGLTVGGLRDLEPVLELGTEHNLRQLVVATDNGLPLASPNGLYNLSRLSAWWLRPGIIVERLQPGRRSRTGIASACI